MSKPNHFDKLKAAYVLNNTIRHVGVLILKTEFRRRELDALQAALALDPAACLLTIKQQSWYSFRGKADIILDASESDLEKKIEWVKWASTAMVEDYEMNDYFA